MEAALLLRIHTWSHPALDAAFLVSHVLGRFESCAILVLAAVVWHLRRGERDWALLWIALGASSYLVQEALKALVQRPRPDLWPRLIGEASFSFPSGHALAAATLYLLLAEDVARHRPRWRRPAFAVAAALVAFVGVGRLYLGLHWPSDVLAGWAMGLAQTAVGVHILGKG